MNLNVLDLFSGIGGFHLGLEKAGFKVNAFNSEIDKYAIEVYKYNFKKSKYVGSVTDVSSRELPRIDAITFGSPCQDFSLAGKRKGMEGNRSSLITEAIRLISECRPRFFIWENVKGTFSSNNGEDFWAIIQAFTNIGGYRLEWQLLNTNWFLPQNRERIYLVGYLGNGIRGQVFPIGKKNISDKQMEFTRKPFSKCLTAKGQKGHAGMQLIGYKIVKPVQIGQSKKTFAAQNGTEIGKENQDAFTIRASNPNGVSIGDFRYDEGYRQRKDGNSPTLHLKCGDDIIVDKIRRLTPIECERLQGFPDNWTKYGTNGEISDTQRYKMCGNAVTVDVVEAVAKNIKQIL